MKVLVFDGRQGAGACSCVGAAVGDIVVGILGQQPGGRLEFLDSAAFESVISVTDQIQQSWPLYNRRDNSGYPATPTNYGTDGNALSSPLSVTARPYQRDNPSGWRYVALLLPGSVVSADGAISIKEGLVSITKGSAAALTLAAPTSGTDDGKRLTIVSETAFAHTVTNASPGFNNGGAASDVATFGAAAGNSMVLIARGGKWWTENLQGVTLA